MTPVIIALVVVTITFLFLAAILSEESEGASLVMAFLAFFAFLGLLASILIAGDQQDDRAEQKTKQTETRVFKACYPRVATHKTESDDRVTFDCANDGKLRVVKK